MLNNGNIVSDFFSFATWQSFYTPGRLIKRYSLAVFLYTGTIDKTLFVLNTFSGLQIISSSLYNPHR